MFTEEEKAALSWLVEDLTLVETMSNPHFDGIISLMKKVNAPVTQ